MLTMPGISDDVSESEKNLPAEFTIISRTKPLRNTIKEFLDSQD